MNNTNCMFYFFVIFIFTITFIHFLLKFLNVIIFILRYSFISEVCFLLITSEDVLKTIGKKFKKARLSQKFTQEYVAENIDISIDLLRNIENGRNIGSIPTLLNLCNFLKLSPNFVFAELLTFEEPTLDTVLASYIKNISKKDKEILKDIIIHIDKNY